MWKFEPNINLNLVIILHEGAKWRVCCEEQGKKKKKETN